MLSGNTIYFLFACVSSHKGNLIKVTDTSASINPSLLSSCLQTALLRLWKTPFDCSQFVSLAFAQPGIIPQTFYLERERKKDVLWGSREGLFIPRGAGPKEQPVSGSTMVLISDACPTHCHSSTDQGDDRANMARKHESESASTSFLGRVRVRWPEAVCYKWY